MTKLQVTNTLGLTVAAFVVLTLATLTFADDPFHFQVNPSVFDPFHTNLVSSEWEAGAGCPTGAKEVKFNSVFPYNLLPPSSYTDPACLTGDPDDHQNSGLVLVKTGETLNDAAAQADITGVKGIILSEVGYDIRKGSHCGAGAPRFNITTTTGKFYFLGCSSPPPTTTTPGTGWSRLRWGTGTAGSVMAYLNGNTLEAITDPIKSMQIVFDEGQDTGPDFSGLAVLDNVDINGVLEGDGRAAEKPSED
jgi:hypothetical protein